MLRPPGLFAPKPIRGCEAAGRRCDGVVGGECTGTSEAREARVSPEAVSVGEEEGWAGPNPVLLPPCAVERPAPTSALLAPPSDEAFATLPVPFDGSFCVRARSKVMPSLMFSRTSIRKR